MGEIESLICNFYLSVATSATEQIGPWVTLACFWEVKQPTNKNKLSQMRAGAEDWMNNNEKYRNQIGCCLAYNTKWSFLYTFIFITADQFNEKTFLQLFFCCCCCYSVCFSWIFFLVWETSSIQYSEWKKSCLCCRHFTWFQIFCFQLYIVCSHCCCIYLQFHPGLLIFEAHHIL